MRVPWHRDSFVDEKPAESEMWDKFYDLLGDLWTPWFFDRVYKLPIEIREDFIWVLKTSFASVHWCHDGYRQEHGADYFTARRLTRRFNNLLRAIQAGLPKEPKCPPTRLKSKSSQTTLTSAKH